MEDLIRQKNAWRRSMLISRRQLTNQQVKQYSASIIAKLEELEPVRNARSIMAFFPINNEVNLLPFIDRGLEAGKTILLPRVEAEGELLAVELKDWEATRSGQFGIREPVGPGYEPEKIDVVLVPALVFDGHGYRLGYGKGYYDRFLRSLNPKAFKCGVAYEFQVIEDVLPHRQDIPVHWIVTEKSELGIDWNFF
ncbi:MAG: 5-formyltetrahydrofolate cyclo-ligase [Syntrophomonas sp.]